MKIVTLFCLSIFAAQISFAQFNPKDTIKTIVVNFKTSNDILSGTNNDVWFDIGPKAWRISDGFDKGTVRQIKIDNPNRLTQGASSSLAEDIPLLVEDFKMIRIEKKGMRLCDIVPGLSTDICTDIGGLSNAPDHPLELLTPDLVTPGGQVDQLEKDVSTARQVVISEQDLLNKATGAFNDAATKLKDIQNRLDDLSRKASHIPSKAVEVNKQIIDLQHQLFNVPQKLLHQVCVSIQDKKWKLISVLTGFGWVVVGSHLVCHDEEAMNETWSKLTQQISDLEKQQATLAGEAGELTLKALSETEIEFNAVKVTKLSLDLQIKSYKIQLATQQKVLDSTKTQLEELQSFIKNKLPFLKPDLIPKLNQWKLEFISIFINGKEFKAYYVNHRFKQGDNTWKVSIGELSPAQQFLHALRVNKNNGGKTLDGIMAGVTSPFFKERDISGWDPGPIGYATIIGTLVNAPNVGADGYVSLDMQIDTAYIGGQKFVLDGRHGINHKRFIRCEYLRVKPSGTLDNSYNNIPVGNKLKISGKVKRDLDRQSYFELHPELSSEVQILN